ncbi:MAG: GIY-YIG nuclease family protein [Candidatus Wallbacteria bacterium]|nr:GIY-YIG nuclease family protein [Candidatus Wallbacteria bacterium]
MRPFFVYILRCVDGSYYVGHTDDLELRLAQPVSGAVPGYTESRRPAELIYQCAFESRQDAFERERQIKGWSRAKKEALIAERWEKLPQLSASRKPGSR